MTEKQEKKKGYSFRRFLGACLVLGVPAVVIQTFLEKSDGATASFFQNRPVTSNKKDLAEAARAADVFNTTSDSSQRGIAYQKIRDLQHGDLKESAVMQDCVWNAESKPSWSDPVSGRFNVSAFGGCVENALATDTPKLRLSNSDQFLIMLEKEIKQNG